jgi:hypothetical protein
MPEENISSPQEVSQPEPAPMMKFSELEAMADQQADKGLEQVSDQQPPVEPVQVAEDPVQKALAESGFKSIEELVKSQKEGHATITKLSQERAALQRDMEALAQFPQLLAQQVQQRQGQPTQPVQPPQGQPDSLTVELFKDMAPFVDQLIEQRASQIASQVVDQKLTMRELGTRVNAKRAENPEEFDDLRPIMVGILKENPHYEAHPQGLDIIYDKAKQVRDSRIANITQKIFGADVPVDKIREAIRQVMNMETTTPAATVTESVNPNVYVPPATATTPPLVQKNTNYDTEIATRMKGKLSPQTVDEITDLWWTKVTAQSQENRPRR